MNTKTLEPPATLEEAITQLAQARAQVAKLLVAANEAATWMHRSQYLNGLEKTSLVEAIEQAGGRVYLDL